MSRTGVVVGLAALGALAIGVQGNASAQDEDYRGDDQYYYSPPGEQGQPDRDPPQTKVARKPSRSVIRTSRRRARLTFTFTADEPGATFECRLDGGAWKACQSPLKKRVAPGSHVFRVQAVDQAGNTDPTPAKTRLTVKRRTAKR